MVFVGCAIFPHGSMVLDDKKTNLPEGASTLHRAGREAGKLIANMKPDLIVLSTPHGIALTNSLGLYLNPSAKGTAEWNGEWTEFSVHVELDNDVSRKLLQHFQDSKVQVEGITTFAKFDAPLRWGEVVPLWFLKDIKGVKYVIISTSAPGGGASVDRSQVSAQKIPINVAIGKALRSFLDSIPQRAVFVVSGDLSHTHASATAEPLYLPNPRWSLPTADSAKPFDAAIEKWVNTLESDVLLKEAASLVSTALSCGFDGFVVLQGCIGNDKSFKGQLLANVAPTYFGMLVAVFTKNP